LVGNRPIHYSAREAIVIVHDVAGVGDLPFRNTSEDVEGGERCERPLFNASIDQKGVLGTLVKS